MSLWIRRSLLTAVTSWAHNWSPLSESRVDGHPQRGMERFTKMLTVPSAVDSAPGTANTSARRLKLSVKRRDVGFSSGRGRQKPNVVKALTEVPG